MGIEWRSWFEGLQRASLSAADDPTIQLQAVRAFIDRHYDQPLDLSRLAAEAAFSPFHFQRLFSKVYGESPHRYLTARRLAEARRLLEQSDMPVTQVCLAVGFQSLGSFSTLFRQAVGHPPSRYRTRWYRGTDLRAPAWIPGCFLRHYRVAQDSRSAGASSL